MEDKQKIVSKLTEFLFANQSKWKNIKVDGVGSNVTFIDLELNDKSLTIEIKNNYISFSFEDGWSYFLGNPLDATFTDFNLALEYLKRVLEFKRIKSFDVYYNGREYQGTVQLTSVYPSRPMGTERLYDINITNDKGAEIVVARLSEYPQGAFNIYEKSEGVDFSAQELINFVKRDSDLFFMLTGSDQEKKLSFNDNGSYLVIKKISVISLLGMKPDNWSNALRDLNLKLEINCKNHFGEKYGYSPTSLESLISSYHYEPVFDVSIIIPPQEADTHYSSGIIGLKSYNTHNLTPYKVKINYSAVSGAEIEA